MIPVVVVVVVVAVDEEEECRCCGDEYTDADVVDEADVVGVVASVAMDDAVVDVVVVVIKVMVLEY